MRKKLLAIIATVAMVVTMIPAMAFADSNVAKVGDVGYATLQGAVDAATDSGTVILLQDVELDSGIRIYGSTTLDLNGYTISVSDTFNGDGVLVVRRGAHLTIADSSEAETGVINGENKAVAVKMTEAADGATGDAASLTVNGSTLIGRYYAISGNGSRDNTSIIINGGKIKGTEYTGIYQPQNGTLTITGGEIGGNYKSVDVRSGSLSITGGELKNGLYIENIASGGYEALGTLSITGGVFTDGSFTNGDPMPAIHYENTAGGSIAGFISGGTYSDESAEAYLAEEAVVLVYTDDDDNTLYGVYNSEAEAVAAGASWKVGDTYYSDYGKALEAAGNDEENMTALARYVDFILLPPDVKSGDEIPMEQWYQTKITEKTSLQDALNIILEDGMVIPKYDGYTLVWSLADWDWDEENEVDIFKNYTDNVSLDTEVDIEDGSNYSVFAKWVPVVEDGDGGEGPEGESSDGVEEDADSEETEDAVDTGDNMNMVIPFTIAGLALATMAAVVFARRRFN